MKNKIVMALLFGSLAGCNTFDGLDSKSNFDCKAPDGVLCDSMTGVMANAKANNLPGQKVSRSANKTPVKGSEFTSLRSRPTSSVLPTMEYTGAPIIRNPKTLRVWVAPWEGADRTLYDQQFFYIVIDNWRWNVEHNSRRVREAYAPSASNGYISPPSSNDSYKLKVQGDRVVPDVSVLEGGTDRMGTIDPLAGDKGNINSAVASELKNMDLDISQFTKPLSNAQ